MSKFIATVLIFFASAFLSNVQAAASPLPAEEAFAFSAHLAKPHQLIAEWHIAPGYYLYRDRIHIAAKLSHPAQIGSIGWPATHTKVDATHKSYKIYEGVVQVSIPLIQSSHEAFTIEVKYQGCSDEGVCYPPMKKIIHLAFPFVGEGLRNAPLLTIGDAARLSMHKPSLEKQSSKSEWLTDQTAIKVFLSHHVIIITLLSFLGLGLLLAFTPCSLPMIPILSSLIVGQKNVTTKKAFYLSLFYVLGMALTYAMGGMVIAWLGSGIQIYFQNPWVIGAFSLLFVLLALSMLDLFEIRLPGALQQQVTQWNQRQKGGTYISSLLMGCLSTLIVSPCVTAPLVGVLAYVTETGNVLLGGISLFALGLGMGIPLLLIGLSAGKYLPKAGPWMELIRKLFAFLLLGMAIWLLSRIFPSGVILFLWAFLLIIIASCFFFFTEGISRFWRYFGYCLGGIFTLYSLVLFAGVGMGYTHPFYPLQKVHSQKVTTFVVVKSMDQLDTILAQAKQEKKPVMLDFYADWCTSCLVMEKAVFSVSEVQQALRDFILVRADVTANNAFDQALLQRYHVIAPPTVVFIERDGQELLEKRIVGEVDHHFFLTRAQSL